MMPATTSTPTTAGSDGLPNWEHVWRTEQGRSAARKRRRSFASEPSSLSATAVAAGDLQNLGVADAGSEMI